MSEVLTCSLKFAVGGHPTTFVEWQGHIIANLGLAEVNGQCGCWAALYGNTHGEFLAASQLLQYLAICTTH